MDREVRSSFLMLELKCDKLWVSWKAGDGNVLRSSEVLEMKDDL